MIFVARRIEARLGVWESRSLLFNEGFFGIGIGIGIETTHLWIWEFSFGAERFALLIALFSVCVMMADWFNRFSGNMVSKKSLKIIYFPPSFFYGHAWFYLVVTFLNWVWSCDFTLSWTLISEIDIQLSDLRARSVDTI